ncbi:ABC transporter ATP-binding protein [Corynebacterium guangdongense]|uniref:ATP-binding cassette subfamily C protein n=1 Tax=Corynebacterium guangdongense TaxID=1783348 RepID=A0ABU1ZUR2_9CORY|nr:ATP-binding cassette subfamily C protein [Corynebacterium guangdongense]WJZ17241.1 putative multidrug resistance ABC transporter ATP-binding/permease protein YheH [Corynebacterium guangdongense]
MTPDALPPAPVRESFRHLGTLPGRPRAGWWLAATLTFAMTLVGIIGASQLVGTLVDAIDGGGDATLFGTLIGLVAAAMLLEVVGRALANYLVTARARILSVDLRRAGLASVLRAPIPDVMELGSGNVITRLTKDIDAVVTFIQHSGTRVIVTALMLPSTLIALVAVHWSYAGVFLLALLPVVPGVRMVLRELPDVSNRVAAAEAYRNNVLLDTISGLPTIRAFGLERWAQERMRTHSWHTITTQANLLPLFNVLMAYASFAYALLVIGALLWSTVLLGQGAVTLGAATTAMVLASRLEIHLFNVLSFTGEMQTAMVQLGRAVSLATLAPEENRAEPADLAAAPEVRVEKLSFAYPNGAAVITDLSLTLAAGTTTALVGTTGAGKSTLAAVLAGLQRPTAGEVYLDDVPASTAPDLWWARHVTLMTQEVHLFSGSLREDLRIAANGASDTTLLDALRTVGLIPGTAAWQRSFPEGLDTRIGAGGEALGPEIAQQISLARVWLRDPPVLILDEATAEAGSDDARALERAAGQVTRGRTSLVVAHRLDQAVAADRIIVMDHGRIVEDGTHAELIAQGGRYARLYARWSPTG